MPFQKGQSGNPKGRPKVRGKLTDLLRESALKDDAATAKRIIRAWEAKAKEGDINAIRLWMERLEGKVPDSVEPGSALEIIVRYANDSDQSGSDPD